MSAKYIRFSPLIFLAVFVIACVIGMSYDLTKVMRPAVINKDLEITFDSVKSIASKNLLLGLSLLIGFLTANILNYILLFYNGIFFGMAVSNYSKIMDIKKMLAAVLPHAIIECAWMILISAFSVKLFFAFLTYINSGYTDKKFIQLLKSKQCIIVVSMVPIAIIAEVVLTPLVIRMFY